MLKSFKSKHTLKFRICASACAAMLALSAAAQEPLPSSASPDSLAAPARRIERKVSPVDIDDNRPPGPVLHYYDIHGKPLDEPVLIVADLDTARTPSAKPVYPLLNSISFGANFFDAIMKIAGQTYMSYDLWASLSLHNWFFPTAEFGIGMADRHPEDGNYRYKGLPSFYAKLGIDYNFLYKSNPDYQAFVGLRAGWSSFRYDVTDITISSGYWGETSTFSLPRQKASAFYGEVLAGLRVRIVDRLSLGWTLRYHFRMHTGKGRESTPWFIPGYGADSPISASFSVIYTLPLAKKPEPAPPTPSN